MANDNVIIKKINEELHHSSREDVFTLGIKTEHQECYFIELASGTLAVGVNYHTKKNSIIPTEKTFTCDIIDFENEDGVILDIDLKECEDRVKCIMGDYLEL